MSIPDTAKSALAAVSDELQSLRGKQAATQKRILEIDAQVNTLRAAPVSIEDFRKYLENYVKARGEKYARSLFMREWTRPNRGNGHDLHKPMQERPWSNFEDEDGNLREQAIALPDHAALWDGRDAFGAWCFFVPDIVTEKLYGEVCASVGTKWPAPDAPKVDERRGLIEVLESEREDLEDELEGVKQSIAEIQRALGA
ncbi:hypothetical protein BA022_09250 [Diaphorobacter nitroreducens]|uniref:hypothetical protein n=1 Tax=Diaphorobacter nitroreducens TaxID=164759 RepID=UPI000B5A0168|nr:hypothetical protein [Diaphorobacter nitroreducens]ASI68708.1 hypothetical protein BA022_09250 [Diaphorobacter nitroreducens]